MPVSDGKKTKTSFSLSGEARRLIEALALFHGISQAAVVEMAVRALARADGVKLPESKTEEEKADAQR